MVPFALRLVASVGGVAAITFVGMRLISVNPSTIGFGYLLFVLSVASTWGFLESATASVFATLAYNFYFLPPTGTLTIAEPENWVALFSFLTTSLVASRLSATARERTREAVDGRQEVERLYTFSRALLLLSTNEPFQKQLVAKLAEVFELSALVLFDRRESEFFRAGPDEFDGLDQQLRDAALSGTSFSDPDTDRTITAVRLGSEPIGSLALQGRPVQDSVLQGISNLVAIGLERARAQYLARQVEVARQSEQLRTTLIDAMAHEFKTPLTSIRAATTSLLASPDQPAESRLDLLRIADEETDRLRQLIDDTVEMARLDTANIEVRLEQSSLPVLVQEVVTSMRKEIDSRPVYVTANGELRPVLVDRRLIKLALKQLIDNALKYAGSATDVTIGISPKNEDEVQVEITDHGPGIPPVEQPHVFERFWRSSASSNRMPGSGLGLSIAKGIANAHSGNLTVRSRPGETTFSLTLPARTGEEQK